MLEWFLEKGGQSIEQVAESSGMQTAATLREHFRRTLGTTLAAYRRASFRSKRSEAGLKSAAITWIESGSEARSLRCSMEAENLRNTSLLLD